MGAPIRPFATSRLPVAEAIVRVLEQAGVSTVFGMAGGSTGRIVGALANHTETIRTVLVRHEALATAAAEAYARVSGRPGVAIGQGSWLLGHGIVGTLEALLAGTPVILIGDLSDGSPFSHHGPYQSGTGEYGNWDARAAFSAVTKLVFEPHEPVQAVQCTQLALKHALAGARGPVAILFHSSSLAGTLGSEEIPRLYSTEAYLQPYVASAPDMSEVASAVREADAPVLLAGGGIRAAKAQHSLNRVAELGSMPVATTASAKGVFPDDHPLAAGVFGTFGAPLANEAIAAADTVIVAGSRLSPTDTANESLALLDPLRQRIIQVDIEPRNTSWTIPASLVVIADAVAALDALTVELCRVPVSAAAARGRRDRFAARRQAHVASPSASSNATPIHPQRLISDLRLALPDDAIVCADAGENRLLMSRYFRTTSSGEYLQPSAAGGMGYAIPAAMGAKVCHPDRPVVAVCGDGGLGMSLPGLLTVVQELIPIVIVVFNNHVLGWNKHAARDRGAPEFKVDLGRFCYAEIAQAMGLDGSCVRSANSLLPAFRSALSAERAALVEVEVSTAETFTDLRTPFLVGVAPRSAVN